MRIAIGRCRCPVGRGLVPRRAARPYARRAEGDKPLPYRTKWLQARARAQARMHEVLTRLGPRQHILDVYPQVLVSSLATSKVVDWQTSSNARQRGERLAVIT